MQKTVFIKTFGCQMNVRDSEIMRQSLSSLGYIEGSEIELADLVILNTCSIRAKAEQKFMSLLGSLRKAKGQRPDMKICVAGCVAQQEGDRLLERMPHIDLIIGTQHIYEIDHLIQQLENNDKAITRTVLEDSFTIPKFIPDNKHISEANQPAQLFRKFVTIMQGCNNYCSYCIVPYTRGREISRKKEEIIDEVTALVDVGVREVTLLGQNVNSYGHSANIKYLPGSTCTFSDLLHSVADIPGLSRLRFTTSHPKDLSNELIQCFKDIPILCPQFHLPVQSGSNEILRKMNRKYSIENYLKKVEKLFATRPDLALTTDIIVGFPGETEKDFLLTMDLLEKVRFHGSFSFKYSDRPGTTSCNFPDKVEEEVKTQRLAVFQKRQDVISLERNLEFVGTTQLVMIEVVKDGGFQGRTGTNHIVHVEQSTDLRPGEMIDISIIHAGQHSLKGKMLN